MALPSAIRVKISSESAGSIAITPVVVRELPIRELVEEMLRVMGKDLERIRETLDRGVFVSGASRFRWESQDVEHEALAALLATFPDPEPTRLFDPIRCSRAVFRAGAMRVDVPRELAAQRRIFKRRSFWDELMDYASAEAPAYVCYSYRERADRYRIPLGPSALSALLQRADLLRYPELATQLRRLPADVLELDVERR